MCSKIQKKCNFQFIKTIILAFDANDSLPHPIAIYSIFFGVKSDFFCMYVGSRKCPFDFFLLRILFRVHLIYLFFVCSSSTQKFSCLSILFTCHLFFYFCQGLSMLWSEKTALCCLKVFELVNYYHFT